MSSGETHSATSRARVRTDKAEILGVLGDIDAAATELRTVHEMGWGFGHTLRHLSRWAPLRENPKFQQLMKEAEARADAQPRPKQ